MSVVAIVQARMGSSRLPGKVLQPIAGRPMLLHTTDRVARARSVDRVVVATTTRSEDDAIVALARQEGLAVHRGSEMDVLARYHSAALAESARTVVRVTSDCPLLAPDVLDRVVRAFETSPRVDYASNTLAPRTFPRGLDVEVFSFEALDRAHREDRDPAWREHVTPFLYRRSDLFSVRAVTHDEDLSSMRWTVDTPDDLAFVRAVHDALGSKADDWREVVALVRRDARIAAINEHVAQKEVDAVRLRPARAEDARRVWEWANDARTRSSSFDTRAIPWQDHEAWFAARLADEGCVFRIAEDSSGSPVGQVRVERDGADEGTISVSVAPEFRGRGYAAIMIRLASEEALASGLRRVHALIRPENGASLRAFALAGFSAPEPITVRGVDAVRMTIQRRRAH